MWFREFIGGLDTRRLPEAASGGVLIKANNGHITRGGEFEQRAAFVPEFALPEGTIGLSHTTAGIFVFGHQAEPSGMPGGVSYQRLQHPDGTTALVRILSTDLYAGKLYAVGEFADGGVYHFYDGAQVTDWFDGRARATFAITGGVSDSAVAASGRFDITGGSAMTPAVAATGGFTVTGGTLGSGNQLTSLTINGVEVLGAAVAHTGNNSTTASAIAAQITSYASSPEYTASAVGAVVTITASVAGAASNGRTVTPTVGGGLTVGSVANMSGGADAVYDRITSVLVAGVDVLGASVIHTGNNSTTAAAVAAQINSYTSSPDYSASTIGATVIVTAAVAGAAANGRVVAPSVSGGATVGGVVNLSGGSDNATSRLLDMRINGVSVIGAPVEWGASNEDTATAVATAINSYVSVPDYTASAVGTSVSVAAAATGSTANGYNVTFDTELGFVATPSTLTMAGGGDLAGAPATGSLTVTAGASGNQMTALTVNNVGLISSAVTHTGNNTTTAAAIATAINSATSSPDYSATSSGAVVTISTADNISSVNGLALVPVFTGTFAATLTDMAGGVDDTYQPGGFVKTVGQKVYSVSGPNLHFSGIQAPTKWTTDSVGAGFIDMSSESSGSEELIAIARYQTFLAVFAERIIQIWYLDPDPELLRQTQVLSNTGTASAHSVTAFGDADLFYLDESGLRSLRARDSSNSAATADIGVPVDEAIVAKLATLDENERKQITGLIEPSDGRFWLIMKDQIFAFSFFAGAKVSAWSTYDTTYQNEDDAAVTFNVEYADVYRRRVYLRAGNTIYVYGGLNGTTYDASVAEAWLPYMDADDPTRYKEFTGIDVVMRGLWATSAAMDPTDETAEDLIAVLDSTTYSMNRIPFAHNATHASLRFRSQGTGPHRLGACVIHFQGSANED